MKVQNLTERSEIYTSNAYLITGTWNAIQDKNVIIDVGRDMSIIPKIESASTGVGKKRVEKIFLTHNHYDHVGILKEIKNLYGAKVYAASSSLELVDKVLVDSQIFKMGDEEFQVIFTPGHSSDSVCFYNRKNGVLFAGDTPLIIKTKEGSYDQSFINVLQRLSKLDIKTIYFGHGEPLYDGCNEIIEMSLKNIR